MSERTIIIKVNDVEKTILHGLLVNAALRYINSENLAERIIHPLVSELRDRIQNGESDKSDKPVRAETTAQTASSKNGVHKPPKGMVKRDRRQFHQKYGPALALMADGLNADQAWAELSSDDFPNVMHVRTIKKVYRAELEELSKIPPGQMRYTWLQKHFGMGIDPEEWRRIVAERQQVRKPSAR